MSTSSEPAETRRVNVVVTSEPAETRRVNVVLDKAESAERAPVKVVVEGAEA